MKVAFKRLNPFAAIPRRGSEHAAGYDLVYCGKENIAMYPGQMALIPTGIAWAAPDNVYGRIAPRSGLAMKFGLDVMAGVVDPDYRGEIQVLLVCLGHLVTDDGKPGHVILEPGDKIAQLIIETFHTPEVEILDVDDKLPDTERGDGGFGSTGK